ncbi:type IV pilin [Geoglobus acetivorans]|uniref:type IV pilin n=1 Tax=Geoglobus acetivorans TaxID=565033 RepID=UPI001930DA74
MKLFRDEKGVSPVIGVILMVAITVILAAVIASFVFGLGSKAPKSAPQASLVASADADATINNQEVDYVLIDHQGGENIPWKDIKIILESGSNKISLSNDGVSGSVSGVTITQLVTTENQVANKTAFWITDEIGTANEFWEPGEKLKIGLGDNSSAGFDFFKSGETVTIKILHTPSNQLILSTQVPAQ